MRFFSKGPTFNVWENSRDCAFVNETLAAGAVQQVMYVLSPDVIFNNPNTIPEHQNSYSLAGMKLF